jgi:hypothetical protein
MRATIDQHKTMEINRLKINITIPVKNPGIKARATRISDENEDA